MATRRTMKSAPTAMPIPKVVHEAPAKIANATVESDNVLLEDDEEVGADVEVEATAAHTSEGSGMLTCKLSLANQLINN